MRCADITLRGTTLRRWNELLLNGVARADRSGLAAARFRPQILNAGFVDVVERKFALLGNPWAKGRREKLLGTSKRFQANHSEIMLAILLTTSCLDTPVHSRCRLM